PRTRKPQYISNMSNVAMAAAKSTWRRIEGLLPQIAASCRSPIDARMSAAIIGNNTTAAVSAVSFRGKTTAREPDAPASSSGTIPSHVNADTHHGRFIASDRTDDCGLTIAAECANLVQLPSPHFTGCQAQG